jgi:electron transfer flavoprotein alpha subunit
MPNVLVFAEVNDGVLHDVSLQCLSAARQVAGADGKVSCLLAGHGVAGLAPALVAAGADSVAVADDERLAAYVTAPFAKAVGACLDANPADLLLLAASTAGNDLGPAVAAARKAACAVDCDGVAAQGGAISLRRAGYDRKVMTTFVPAAAGLVVGTLRDGAAPAPVADTARQGAIAPLALELTPAELVSKVLRRDVAKKTVNLKDAKIIVAAGAGVGSPEGLATVRDLAQALGAEIGATRAVVDAGWLPADHQIGQTGATVRPEVYIACGISGAVQHRVGMMDARKIVAINSDGNAPIFRIAHYKIVGDLKVVVPKLVKLLKA